MVVARQNGVFKQMFLHCSRLQDELNGKNLFSLPPPLNWWLCGLVIATSGVFCFCLQLYSRAQKGVRKGCLCLSLNHLAATMSCFTGVSQPQFNKRKGQKSRCVGVCACTLYFFAHTCAFIEAACTLCIKKLFAY